MMWEESSAKFGEVKPLIVGVLDSPIVEIEAVYVDIRYHHPSLNMNKGHLAVALALPPKQQGQY